MITSTEIQEIDPSARIHYNTYSTTKNTQELTLTEKKMSSRMQFQELQMMSYLKRCKTLKRNTNTLRELKKQQKDTY